MYEEFVKEILEAGSLHGNTAVIAAYSEKLEEMVADEVAKALDEVQ